MATSRVSFDNGRGNTLAGRLERPAGEPRGWALFAHCFTCGMQSTAAYHVSRRLADLGIAVLRFDFTGIGESGDEATPGDFSAHVDDVTAAAAYLSREHRAPGLLVGHSLGGTAVLAAAGRLESVRSVVTLGAPASPEHLRRLLTAGQDEAGDGTVRVQIGGSRFRLDAAFLRDLEQHDLATAISRLGSALLIMHSPTDSVVEIGEATRIFTAARHPRSFIALDGADHLLSADADSRWAASLIASWADRYLDAAPEEERTGPAQIVAVTGPEGFYTRISAPGHRFAADEPTDAGGSDLAPTPYDLLAAALAACTAMTLQLYARRKGWPLENVRVGVSRERIHARDCRDCDDGSVGLHRYQRTLTLSPTLSDGQRQDLLRIAERCPVHRSLQSAAQIETRLID